MIKLKFQTVSPLHISNGNELEIGLDYVIKNNMFCKTDMVKFASILSGRKIFDFGRKEGYSLSEILKIIEKTGDFFNNNDYEYRLNIRTDFYELITNERAEGRKFVREFINSNGKFYIPASSVKGAILTILNENSLGIQPGIDANIKDKFVMPDSEIIPSDNFVVMLSNNRPPSTSLICLRKDKTFEMKILKEGSLNLNKFREALINYTDEQITTAKSKIKGFIDGKDLTKGAGLFFDTLETISNITLEKEEYLINIGFGGGSWFKVFKGIIPKFKSKNPNNKGNDEEAHTSISFKMKNENYHIGWCKLKIIEE
jgi:CRISPR/Cas system CSM-associated protein Csm5 (group 7 of RAMP superfamily)